MYKLKTDAIEYCIRRIKEETTEYTSFSKQIAAAQKQEKNV